MDIQKGNGMSKFHFFSVYSFHSLQHIKVISNRLMSSTTVCIKQQENATHMQLFFFWGGGGYLVLQTLLGWGSAFGLISWVPGGIIPFGGSFTFTSSPASINKQRLSYKKIKNTGNISQTVPAEHAKEPLSCFTNGTCRYLTICYFLNIYTVTWKFTDKELYVLFRHLSQIVSIALLGNFVSY